MSHNENLRWISDLCLYRYSNSKSRDVPVVDRWRSWIFQLYLTYWPLYSTSQLNLSPMTLSISSPAVLSACCSASCEWIQSSRGNDRLLGSFFTFSQSVRCHIYNTRQWQVHVRDGSVFYFSGCLTGALDRLHTFVSDILICA
jgi:hypothetical protein